MGFYKSDWKSLQKKDWHTWAYWITGDLPHSSADGIGDVAADVLAGMWYVAVASTAAVTWLHDLRSVDNDIVGASEWIGISAAGDSFIAVDHRYLWFVYCGNWTLLQ